MIPSAVIVAVMGDCALKIVAVDGDVLAIESVWLHLKSSWAWPGGGEMEEVIGRWMGIGV